MLIVWRSEPVISEAKALFSLAAPFIIGNLAWSLIAAGNLFLIGHLGSDAVAAGALATNLYNAFQIFGIGLATAISPMIARERGQNKYSVREIRRTVPSGNVDHGRFLRANMDCPVARSHDPSGTGAGCGPCRPGSDASAGPAMGTVALYLVLWAPAFSGRDGTSALGRNHHCRRAARQFSAGASYWGTWVCPALAFSAQDWRAA